MAIERDVEKFNKIVRGKIKQNLKKYMSQDEILGKKGGDVVKIPLPQISLPRFKFANPQKGVGQGKADSGKPGNEEGNNVVEVDVSIDELADILGEQLQLPRIEPKGQNEVTSVKSKYRSLQRIGPESLRSFKHTFKEALKRSIGAGAYDPDNPVIIPIREDKRFKSPEHIPLPQSQALIFYIMDISGSMGKEEKDLARATSFWIDTWLRKNFKNIASRYIVHHTSAREVDRDTFYSLSNDGGTIISSAYSLVEKILAEEYDPDQWNIYIYQYSDGDDWGDSSSEKTAQIIKQLLPYVNQVAYCQVNSRGNFLSTLRKHFLDEDKVTWAKVERKDQIYDAIKTFFKGGQK